MRNITITIEDRKLGTVTRRFVHRSSARKFIAESLELNPSLAAGNSGSTITWAVSRDDNDPHWTTIRFAREFAGRSNVKRLMGAA